MNRPIPVAILAFLIISALLGLSTEEIAPPTPTAPTVETPPVEEHAPALARLIAHVDEARDEIVTSGREAYGPNCLKLYPRAFRRASEAIDLPRAILAGIAGYESTGCALPRGGKGNIMHVVHPSDVHLREAAGLLGIPTVSLNWQRHSEHSTVLGAVMLQNMGEDLVGTLAAYHGGNKEHAYAILAHSVLAQRHLRRQNSDYWDSPESEVSAEELRSLAGPFSLVQEERAESGQTALAAALSE